MPTFAKSETSVIRRRIEFSIEWYRSRAWAPLGTMKKLEKTP